ncbi:MAG: hypothetical protein ACI4WX_01900 [Aristaeellaceae bacterium]
MKKKDIRSMLTLLSDMETAELHNDRLSSVIRQTLRAAEMKTALFDDELLDDELEDVAAAQKAPEYRTEDLLGKQD